MTLSCILCCSPCPSNTGCKELYRLCGWSLYWSRGPPAAVILLGNLRNSAIKQLYMAMMLFSGAALAIRFNVTKFPVMEGLCPVQLAINLVHRSQDTPSCPFPQDTMTRMIVNCTTCTYCILHVQSDFHPGVSSQAT
jgi:hypothetical protein